MTLCMRLPSFAMLALAVLVTACAPQNKPVVGSGRPAPTPLVHPSTHQPVTTQILEQRADSSSVVKFKSWYVVGAKPRDRCSTKTLGEIKDDLRALGFAPDVVQAFLREIAASRYTNTTLQDGDVVGDMTFGCIQANGLPVVWRGPIKATSWGPNVREPVREYRVTVRGITYLVSQVQKCKNWYRPWTPKAPPAPKPVATIPPAPIVCPSPCQDDEQPNTSRPQRRARP